MYPRQQTTVSHRPLSAIIRSTVFLYLSNMLEYMVFSYNLLIMLCHQNLYLKKREPLDWSVYFQVDLIVNSRFCTRGYIFGIFIGMPILNFIVNCGDRTRL